MIRCPAVMRSPGFRVSRAFNGMLLTKVPFLLPRSCTVQSSSSGSKAKCWRERPESSGKLSSTVLERPTATREPNSGTVFSWPSGPCTSSSRRMAALEDNRRHYNVRSACGAVARSLHSELDSLRQRQLRRPINGVGLAAHVGFPGIAAGFAASAGLLLPAKGAPNLSAAGADIDIGNAAIAAAVTEEGFGGD